MVNVYIYHRVGIIESVDSISRDEPDYPLTQCITNAGISRARYTITHFKHHRRVLRLISNRIKPGSQYVALPCDTTRCGTARCLRRFIIIIIIIIDY